MSVQTGDAVCNERQDISSEASISGGGESLLHRSPDTSRHVRLTALQCQAPRQRFYKELILPLM